MSEEINNSQSSDIITGSSSTPVASSTGSEQNSSVGNVYPDVETNAISTETLQNLNKQGRVVLQIGDKDLYDNSKYRDPLVAMTNEMVWDTNNIPWIARVDENGKVVWRSGVKEMYDVFMNLKELGVLDAATAFGINGKIYHLFFDATKKWVGLNPQLVFDTIYRYYAIRSMVRNDDGGYDYFTATYGKNQDNTLTLLNNFVDMDRVPSPSGDGTTISKPRQAKLNGDMVNGGKYVVEFYDDDCMLVGTEVFQAISVKALEYSLTPDKCVIGMVVKPNNEEVEEDSCFVYSNDDPTQVLNFRVFLKYADDSLVDVSDQRYTTGRLVIEGLDKIETTKVTGPDDEPQTINITYYLAKDNSNLQDGELAEGGNVDVGTFSITKKIKVYVKESLYDDIEKITPAGWINYPSGNHNQKIMVKLFGLYKSGVVKDITNFVSTNDRFSGFGKGTSIYDKTSNAFYADSQYIGALPETIIVKVPQSKGSTLKSFTFKIETSSSHRRLIIDNENSIFIRYNPTVKLMKFDTTQTVEKIKETNTYIVGETTIIPTHFTVRSAIDPSVTLAKNIPIEQALTGFSYAGKIDDVLVTDYPFIVEFFNIEEDSGMISSIYTTSASRYYAQQVSSL